MDQVSLRDTMPGEDGEDELEGNDRDTLSAITLVDLNSPTAPPTVPRPAPDYEEPPPFLDDEFLLPPPSFHYSAAARQASSLPRYAEPPFFSAEYDVDG